MMVPTLLMCSMERQMKLFVIEKPGKKNDGITLLSGMPACIDTSMIVVLN